jgi:hypothetical protein
MSGNQLGGVILSVLHQMLGVIQARVDQLTTSSVESGK